MSKLTDLIAEAESRWRLTDDLVALALKAREVGVPWPDIANSDEFAESGWTGDRLRNKIRHFPKD